MKMSYFNGIVCEQRYNWDWNCPLGKEENDIHKAVELIFPIKPTSF